MTKGIIDRFEGDIALIETEQGMIQVDKNKLPAEAREGDCILLEGEQVVIDQERTSQRKAELERRLRSLFSK